MPRRRSGESDTTPDSSVQAALEGLRRDLRTVRAGQLKLMKALVDLRHELNHRMSTSREELGALVKASHAELSQRIESFDRFAEEQSQRLSDLERDFDDVFEPRP